MKKQFAILSDETSIKEAIQLIARSKHHTAFTLGPDGKYAGTISINDLRRLILSGVNEMDMLKCHPPSSRYSTNEEDLKNGEIISSICSDLTLQGVEYIPVLDGNGKIIDVFSLTELRRLFDAANIAVPAKKKDRQNPYCRGGRLSWQRTLRISPATRICSSNHGQFFIWKTFTGQDAFPTEYGGD